MTTWVLGFAIIAFAAIFLAAALGVGIGEDDNLKHFRSGEQD